MHCEDDRPVRIALAIMDHALYVYHRLFYVEDGLWNNLCGLAGFTDRIDHSFEAVYCLLEWGYFFEKRIGGT